MKKVNSLVNRVAALALSIVMVLGLLPMGVLAASSSVVTTTLGDEQYTVGQTAYFTVTTIGNEDADTMVLGSFVIQQNGKEVNITDVATLEYQESTTKEWYEFYGDFGPAAGFRLQEAAATSNFRVTFKESGEYTVKVFVKALADSTELCAVEKTVFVAKADSATITTTLADQSYTVGQTAYFTVTTTGNEDADTMVLGSFVIQQNGKEVNIADVATLEYQESTTKEWYEFYGDFGPAAGFRLQEAAATSNFRVTFKESGEYTINVFVKAFADGEKLCSVEETVAVKSNQADFAFADKEPVISFNDNADNKYSFKVQNAKGTVTYTIETGSDIATINATTGDLTVLKPGQITVKAYDSGNALYNPAEATYTLTVNKAKQEIKFATPVPKDQWIGQVYKNIASGGDGTGAISYWLVNGEELVEEINGVAKVNKESGEVTFLCVETQITIKAIKAADDYYDEATATYSVTAIKQASAEFGFETSGPITITYDPENLRFENPVVGNDINDEITWSIVSGGDVAELDTTTGILTIKKAGTIVIKATVAESSNYLEKSVEYTLNVKPADQADLDISNIPTRIIYSPEIQDGLIVAGGGSGTGAYGYEIVEGNEFAEIDATTGAIRILKAGNFDGNEFVAGSVKVKITKAADDCYSAAEPVYVTISLARAEQSNFGFGETEEVTVTYNDNGNRYTLVATGGQSSMDIVYGVTPDGVAQVDSNGVVTIVKAGTVVIEAKKPADDCYNEITDTYTLNIEKDEQSFTFAHAEQIEEKYGLTSFATQITTSELNSGTVTYAVSENNIGAAVDRSSGLVTFANSTGKVGTVTVTVTMVEDECYKKYTDTYTITLDYEEIPDPSYTLSGDKNSGWFTGDVTILAPAGYQISYSNDLTDNKWDSSVLWGIDGEDGKWAVGSEPVVYLKKVEQGQPDKITDAIYVSDLKRDTGKPDGLTISYHVSVLATIGEKLFGFNATTVMVTVTAADSLSGIDKMEYSLDGGFTYTEITASNGKYEFSIPAQYRGQLCMRATDVAGNPATYKHLDNNTDKILVIDDTAPGLTVGYTGSMNDAATEGIRYVKNEDGVKVVLKITDENFDLREADPTVVVIRNNEATPIVLMDGDAEAEWIIDATSAQLTFDLTEDGDYVIKAEFTDRLSRKATYESEVRVDREKPTIESTIVDGKYYTENETFVLTVDEHNFDAARVNVVVNAVDKENRALLSADEIKKFADDAKNPANWDYDESGDAYMLEIPVVKDGNYTVTVDAADALGWEADTYSVSFSVDKEAPTELQITYSTPVNTVWDNILKTVTFGAYNPNENKPLIVTLTARDTITGVDYFEWFYTREDGASEGNKPSEGAENANILYVTQQDENSSVSSVSFEIDPQTRGYISFRATDRAGNTYGVEEGSTTGSQWVSDSGRINIVDTIAPTREVTYEPTNVVDVATMKDTTIGLEETSNVVLYYKKDAVATFKVTETNFYAEDVNVFVNGEKVALDKAEWTRGNADNVWINTLTIAEEGDYVITMTYTDRSKNEMVQYTSQRIVIDKTAPVINVKYSNNDVKNTIDGRDYFSAAQTATITIKEHNFRADDVVIKVTAKDVLGADVLTLDADGTVKAYADQGTDRKSWTSYEVGTWRVKDDTFIITLNFTTDANYTFDIEYQDLAKNKAADYEQDLFTVDATAPENLTVTYSTSVLEQIKESVSFGYYNAMMTVTITAEDDTSGIYHFAYSYIKGKDVSGVNAELLDQAIKEAEITYDGKKATATFNIPKMVLENDNQFNGTVEFTAYDRSEVSTELKDSMIIIVDNITPTSKITYNAPVQTANGISYYDGNINATIVINEANFDANDVVVSVTKDGTAFPVNVTWSDNNVDTHTGTFTLIDDGDYIVSVQYKDKSGNQMASYTSDELTLDATKPTINVSNIKSNSANKDEKYGFVITIDDTNLDASSIKPVLKAVVQKEEGVYVTVDVDLGNATAVVEGQTYTYTVEDLPDDGLYTLTCEVKDLSANGMSQIVLDDGESYDQVQFSINRSGSAFGYGNKFTEDLVGQYYIYSVDEDVVIVEVNVDPIEEYKVTLNGKDLVEGADYTTVQTSQDGEWSKRTYTIQKSLFESEGEYSIIVTSTDKADTTAFSDVKNLSLAFVVDQTKPTLTITGLEAGGRYQTDAQTVTLIPTDEGGRLNGLTVLVLDSNGNPLKDESGTDISVRFEMSGEELLKYLEENDGKVTFTVPEGLNNQVKIICNDCAVNAEDLTNEYNELFEKVTVSQNQLVIFYANTPLFVGTIVGALVVIALIIFLIKHKKDKKAKA